MSNQIKGTLYFLYANNRFSLIVFWSILMGIVVLSIGSTFIFADSKTTFSLTAPIYAYGAIIGYLYVKGVIPYIIKLGATRTNIFISIGLFSFLITFFNSFMANTIYSFISFFYGDRVAGILTISENENSFTLNHIADVLPINNWITRVTIDTSISLFLLVVMFIIALIFHRFGLVGGFVFLAACLFTFFYGMSNGWLLDFFINIFSNFQFVFFYQLFAVSLFLFAISYLLVRRMTIK